MKIKMQQLLMIVSILITVSIAWAGPYSGSFVDDEHPEGTIDEGIPGFIGPAGIGEAYKENHDGSSNGNFVNPIIQQWASEVVDYSPAPDVDDDWKKPGQALGPVTGSNFDIVSLGDLSEEQLNDNVSPGEITLKFDFPIVDKPGNDLVIFENGFTSGSTAPFFAELAYVEVSSDGNQFARFPSDYSAASDVVGVYGDIDPTWIYNLAGKHANAYGTSWGTPFDLSTLEDDPAVTSGEVDLNHIQYVKIVDIPGSGFFEDANGQPIYDGWLTQGSGGIDLEAVGAIHTPSGADLENLELEPDSYWAGAYGPPQTRINRQIDVRALCRNKQQRNEVQTFFASGGMNFPNNLGEWLWSGFAYSNMKDTETPGYLNQYSAFTGIGVHLSPNYGIAFIPSDYAGGTHEPIPQSVTFDNIMPVTGMYITNTTYAMLSMLNGDNYAKAFGGDTGDDPDYFKVIIKGIDANEEYTDPVEFFLADFRFENNYQDYILDQWTWVDLSHMGELYGLEFSVDSSDKGAYGMNTPAYFAFDNINGTPPDTGNVMGYVKSNMDNYSNPIAGATVYLKTTSEITTTDASGHFRFENVPSGYYVIEVVANFFNDTIADIHTDVSTLVHMSPVSDVDFEDLELEPDSYWNGGTQTRNINHPEMVKQMAKMRNAVKASAEAGFQSGIGHFQNSYNSQYNSWTGFSYSNMADTETPGLGNQFSAITGKGVHGSPNFALAYIPTDWQSGTNDPIPQEISFDTDEGILMSGMYVTNTTYAYFSMKDGDSYAKKFGGESGDDPDFFKLIITGYDNNDNETGVVEFYLADFRSDDHSEDYIVDTWEWVDLSSLGRVKSLQCSVISSDTGTPTYFALDNINQVTLGSIEGIVSTDITGQPATIMDALVSVNGTDIVTHTDEYGRFQLDHLPTGDYQIDISSDKFAPITIDVTVENAEYVEIPQDITVLSEPVSSQCKWDINDNGQIDLAEIIHYLQILSSFK
jgi:hypothetical protein